MSRGFGGGPRCQGVLGGRGGPLCPSPPPPGVLGALGRPVAGEGLVAALELALTLAEEEDEPEGRRVM